MMACAVSTVVLASYVPSDPPNEFEQWIAGHTTGPIIHKRRGYFAVYERHFGPVRTRVTPSRPVRMLEIGVQSGGSLEMWKSYFGEDSLELHGIDINPETARFNQPKRNITIHVGSTSDPTFMRSTVVELPTLDIVIDDARITRSIPAVCSAFPQGDDAGWRVPRGGPAYKLCAHLGLQRSPSVTKFDGRLACTDWHNAEFEERGQNWTFMATAKALVDELHDTINHDATQFVCRSCSQQELQRRRREDQRPRGADQHLAAFTNSTASIHFHSGVVVFEKGERRAMDEDVLAGDLKVPHSNRLEHRRPPGTPTKHRGVGFEHAARLIATGMSKAKRAAAAGTIKKGSWRYSNIRASE